MKEGQERPADMTLSWKVGSGLPSQNKAEMGKSKISLRVDTG